LILLYLSLLQDHLGAELFRDAEMAATLLPSDHDAADGLGEIAEILAAGLIRLQQRKSSPLSREGGESSLDFPVDQRGHPTPVDRRMADG
jgi:hypothetical protein